MDDFSHITEELEVVEEGLKFRFNTARCVATDKEKVPKADDFELFRVRRTYHFNKGREDHVILTVPEPECLVLINKQLKSMQQVRIGSDAPCGPELKPGAAAHVVAVKGLGCVVDDPIVEWVAAPDEDCGTAGVEAKPSSIEEDVNNANINKQSEQDENLSALKEICNSFSPVKLNNSEIASGTYVQLAIKRKKSSKQRSSKRLKRKLNSSISPERKCDDMCKIEQALIVALKNSESCKSSEVNRLHNISTTKITRNAKERSNINGDTADFKEKLGTNRINEVCRECTVRLEDISSILNATYEKRFNSRTDQIQEAEEAVCLKENLNTELNSGEKPPELSVAQEENLIRVEDNLYMDNISTKAYKNVEKVEVCSNITRGNSTLRKMLEAPLKSSKFNQNAATTTQLEKFYKRANEQRANQIEEELIPNSLTSIQKDSEVNKDLTDGVYRKNTLMALHEVSQSEKNSHKIQHKLDFNKSTFHCDPSIIIKEEFNCFMEDHAFLQNETRPSLRNSDFKNETNEENWIYGQQLFQKDQHIAQLEEYGRTAERVHKSEIIEEFEETFKSEESSGFADEEHEETFFASRNSRIQQNLTEQVCEVEIFIPDDDDESESGYSQEHSQMDESHLEQEKMKNTEICRIGDIVTDKTRVQKNISCNIVANDSKKSFAENDVAIALVDSHIDASSLEENQHNYDPSEDVRTCDDKVATTEITIKDVYTQDCSQTNANSSAENVESQGRIQEQVSFDPSSCNSSEDAHSCNNELANMDTSSSEDIHKIQENIESQNMDCGSKEIQHCDQNTHCIQADAEDAQTLHENREFPERVSWGAQNCDKNISDDAEGTFALEHSQMDVNTSGDSHRIEKIVEAPGEINLDCRRTEDQDSSDSHEGIGACTITHLQTDTNSSEDKLQPPLATLNAGNILEQNNYDGNELKADCVSELFPMSAISSEDAHQSKENLESPIRFVRDENNTHNHDTSDSNKDKTTAAVEFSLMNSHSTEDAHILQDNSVPPVEVAWDGKNFLQQNSCDTNGDKSVCVREPSPTPTIVSDDAHQSQENFEPPVEVARDGRNILKQNSYDANGDKSVCVHEPSPTPMFVSDNAHQSQENFEPLVEVAQDGRNIYEQNSCDAIGDKSVYVRQLSPKPMIDSGDTHQSQENFEHPLVVAQDGRNVHEQSSCDANRDESVCVRNPSPAPMIVSEDTHQSQENFEHPLKVAQDGRNIHEQSSCDANRDESVCVRNPSPAPMIVSEDAHQSQENFEPLVEVARDGRNLYEQNSCDVNRDKSVCVREPLPAPSIVLEEAHQSQENFELPLEVAQDGRNVHEQNSCDAIGEDAHKSQGNFEPPVKVVRDGRNILEQNSCDANGEGAHKSQGNVEPPVEVAQDGRNVHEQNSCHANRNKSVCVRELSPAPAIVSEDAHQSQENLEPLVEVARDGRNDFEQNNCDAIGEGAHKSLGNFEPPVEIAQDGRNVHEQNSCDANRDKSFCVRELSPAPTIVSEDAHQSQGSFEPSIEVARDGRTILEQNSCDANGGKSVCVRELSPAPTIVSEDAHQSQGSFEPSIEVARDGRTILEQNSCDANGEGAHKSQGNFEPPVEVARDGRNVHEQNSCDANRNKSVCVRELSPALAIVCEDAHQSQENLEPLVEVARDGRNDFEKNNCDAIGEGAHKSLGNIEPPVEIAQDGRNVHEQNSCDANRDKSVCVRELSPAPTIVSEDAHQPQEHLEPLVEVARDGRNILEQNSCEASGEGAHKSQGNFEPPVEVARDGRNVHEQNSCDANRDKSVCVRELSPAPTIVSEDAHQSQEHLEPLVEVARDGRNILEQNSCEASGEGSHKSQGNFEPPVEVTQDSRNVLKQSSYDVIGYKSVCIHEPSSISITSSEDARQSQGNLSPREVVQDGRESRDQNTCNVNENTCARKDSEMDINTSEDVHKLQENLQLLSEVACIERNIQERNSCEGNEDENTCTRKYSEMDVSSLEDVHKLQENLKPGEVTWNGRNVQEQNSCKGNENNNTCASKDSELDIHSLEDVHKLQENLGSILEVTWDEREVQKQNNCDCNEDKCACAMELSPMGSSSSEDANKPEENLEVPIEVASDEKQIHKQNSCDDNEVKSACALEFSQMDTSFAEDKEECRQSEKKVDWDDDEDKSAFKCSQMDMSSAEDVRKLQENLEPMEKVDLNETKMQQSSLNQNKYDGDGEKCACAFEFPQLDTDSSEEARKLQENLDPLKEIDVDGSNMQQSNCDDNEDKSACAVELLHMETSSSVDVNELQENLESLEKIGLHYRKIKDNKNKSSCALECSLKISTSSEATNKTETNFEPLEMGFDEENIPAYIVTKIPHDFVGFSDEESKTPLLNLILTDDLCASEDKSGDLCKTEDSCKFSSNTLEFYKFSTKRIKLIEENLSYICNKHHSLYKQYEFNEKPILNRKNAREVRNSRNLTEIVDHDYVKEYRNLQSNFMLNREQGTQTLATKEDFANKTNVKPVFNREGRQVEEMEQLLEELIQEHIKNYFAQDGIDEEIATDQEKNDIKVAEEKESKGPCDHANNSEEVSEVSQNKKNSSDLKPAATPKHTQVFEYNTELSNDSIISERQLEIDHGDSKGNVANDKKSSDIFMEVNDKNGKLFKCNQCNFKVNKENHLKIHSRVHILSCWCNICPETFADTTALQKHVKVSHSCHVKAQRIVMNNSGEKPFQLSSDKPSHISSKELSQASSENLYKCGYCNYTTSYINRLQHHKRVHDKQKLYECDKCSFTTLREWKLKRHHENVHSSNEDLRECDECGFISIYQHEWDMHMQLHSGKKLYQCDMCSFSTAHVGYFHAHRGFHLTSQVKKEEPDEPEDRLRCEECDYRTDLHSSLLRHGKKFGHRVASHPSLSQSRLVCSECNYVANSYVTLKQHLMTHIDLKPCHLKDKLECSKCKKVCLTHKDLKRHMNTEHPGIA